MGPSSACTCSSWPRRSSGRIRLTPCSNVLWLALLLAAGQVDSRPGPLPSSPLLSHGPRERSLGQGYSLDVSDSFPSTSLRPSLAMRPPMGWNSWNHFGCGVTEDAVKGAADALVSTGLADLGYVYVNVDDCWAASTRDAQGQLQPDLSTFPSGIKALADYVHARGLKFGIYSDAGYRTCAGRPGSLGHEKADALSFASWGVDYLKYDNCFAGSTSPRIRYPVMRDGLIAAKRDVVFSMCEWGVEDPATWARGVADLWRTTEDVQDTWDSVLRLADLNDKWAAYAGPGGWNDPDMLEVGNGGMTEPEYRVHFSLWAIMKAPLLIGSDLRNASASTLRILGNKEVIALNQDAVGAQARKVRSSILLGDVWAGPLTAGRLVMGFVNRGIGPLNITAPLALVDLSPTASMKVRDVWQGADWPTPAQGSLTATVASHDIALLLLTPLGGSADAGI